MKSKRSVLTAAVVAAAPLAGPVLRADAAGTDGPGGQSDVAVDELIDRMIERMEERRMVAPRAVEPRWMMGPGMGWHGRFAQSDSIEDMRAYILEMSDIYRSMMLSWVRQPYGASRLPETSPRDD